MPRIYVIIGLIVVAVAGTWIWSPANIGNQNAPEESSKIIAERAATATIVAEERMFCHDPETTPAFTVQLGSCLPGAREITYSEYQAGKTDP